MIVVNTPSVEGKRTLEVTGLVQGNTVRTRHVGQYSRLLADAREEALQRMLRHADGMGANAVVNLRFTTSSIMHGASEMLTYGTAVVVED